MKIGRYGEEVLRTLKGSWYWCVVLEEINFVPAGKRTSHYQTGVHTNTREQVVRQVAQLIASGLGDS